MSHPPGLGLILFTELWERFSYYGMRSLLMLYMVGELQFSVADAGWIYGLYTGLAYLLPVLGGLWADRQLGTRRAITAGAALMACGHLAMVLRDTWAFYLALVLLVLGTGLFKANTASLLGELYAPNDPRRDAGFNLFYLTVNVGGLAAPLVCGTLAAHERWHWGFGAAGVGMLVGLVAWVAGAGRLGKHGLAPAAPARAARRGASKKTSGEVAAAELVEAAEPAGLDAPLDRVARQRIWALVCLAVLGNVSLWAAIGQAGSSMALFAARDTNLTLPLLGRELPASWFQAVNPLFILLGMPLVSGAWHLVARRGHDVSPATKFAVGLSLVSLGFLAMSLAGSRVDGGAKVSMGWLLCATFLNTAGELCVSPVGLSLVTKLSPKRYAAALMGFWYASIAVANWGGGQLAGLYETLDKAALFAIPCAMTGAMALVLLAASRSLTRLMHGVR